MLKLPWCFMVMLWAVTTKADFQCDLGAPDSHEPPPEIAPFIYSQIYASNGTEVPHQIQHFGLAYQDEHIFVLGGVAVADGSFVEHVWKFNTINSAWNQTHLVFERYGHCVAQNGSFVYIIGGEGNGTVTFQTLELQNLTLNTTYPSLPVGHKYFSACAIVGDSVAVFGGCETSSGTECSGDLDLYNTTEGKWVKVTGSKGAAPSPRYGATLNVFENNTYAAILIGGIPANGTSVFLYQFDNNTWVPISAPAMPALAFHTSVLTNASDVIVFGGQESSSALSGVTYVISVTPRTANVSAPHLNSTTPSPRKGHGAIYADNRMMVYGGDYKSGEHSSSFWQLAVEHECFKWQTCGDCLLSGCYWCRPNGTNYCVAGHVAPYIASTCNFQGWNATNIICCRRSHPTSTALVASTVVILVAIAILVVATYIVDWKKGKASSGGYEPIMGI